MSSTNTQELPNDRQRRKPEASHEREGEKVRILAARLRMSTDEKLNKTTPSWVRELANKKL